MSESGAGSEAGSGAGSESASGRTASSDEAATPAGPPDLLRPVVEALMDLQADLPSAAALVTVSRGADAVEQALVNYRMSADHVRAGLEEFIPRSPEFALVLDSPDDVLDWTRVPWFRETGIAREHLLAAGYTQGVSFVLRHGGRRVGTLHLNYVDKHEFSDAELQLLDSARRTVERHVGAIVLAGDVGLTPRELEVLRLMAEGLSNVRIGEALHLSRSTVMTHVEHVLHKLGASNRVQAVRTGLARLLI